MSKEDLAKALGPAVSEIKQTPDFKYKEASEELSSLAYRVLSDFGGPRYERRRTEKIELMVDDLLIKIWLEDDEYTMQGDTNLYPALKIRTDPRSHTQEARYFFLKPFGFENLKGQRPSFEELQSYILILKAMYDHYVQDPKKKRFFQINLV